MMHVTNLTAFIQACGLTTIQHTSASLKVTCVKQSWIRHTHDWHVRDNVGQRSVANSVACMTETSDRA